MSSPGADIGAEIARQAIQGHSDGRRIWLELPPPPAEDTDEAWRRWTDTFTSEMLRGYAQHMADHLNAKIRARAMSHPSPEAT